MDLDRAITMLEQIVAFMQEDPDRGSWLKLGIALQSRFERTGLIDELLK